MKKIFFVFAFLSAVVTGAWAQESESAEAMLEKMKERIKPELVSKAGISEQEAEKVVNIHFALQRQRRQVRIDQTLTAEQKQERNLEINAARDKEYSGIPLTPAQIKAVNLYFEEEKGGKKLKKA